MYPVHTDMERIKRITDLRKGILPKDLLTNFPEIVSFINRINAGLMKFLVLNIVYS